MPKLPRITRSRNGCAVCKSKRLKCDEAKPNCSRCERLGIPCPGYQKPVKWAVTPRSPPSRSLQQRSRPPSDHHDTLAFITANDAEMAPSMAFNPIAPDLYDMELFDQVTDMLDMGNSTVPGLTCDSFDSPFAFLETGQEPPESSNATSPATELDDNAELWLDTVLNSQDTTNASLGTPVHHQQTIAGHLQDRSSVLVEYYFKDVCGMMSCYDSRMNPYRTTISNVWTRSPSLYYIIQSMAAACLSEVSPGLGAAGRQLRDQASASLYHEISSSAASGDPIPTPSLLALVMLGFSLSWHDAKNVGQAEFDLLSRTILSPETQQTGDEVVPLAEMQRKVFFYNSFVYWRMLLSFVTDRELPTPAYPALYPQPQPSQPPHMSSFRALTHHSTRIPHPQTGIGIQVLEILGQVGALVRSERRRLRSCHHASRADILAAQSAIDAAESLHAQLCGIDLPREVSVVDSGDETTTIGHLLKVAEAYRCGGLLQLYCNFPDLLPATGEGTVEEVLASTSEGGITLQTPAETSYSQDEPQGPDYAVRGTILTCLALHILALLRDIPTSSRSRSIQPLLHVIVCSELSLTRRYVSLPSAAVPEVFMALGVPVHTPSMADIFAARRAVLVRFAAFETVLAAKPIRQMTRLVKETWAAMDEGQGEVFWMDVMMDGGYETLMG